MLLAGRRGEVRQGAIGGGEVWQGAIGGEEEGGGGEAVHLFVSLYHVANSRMWNYHIGKFCYTVVLEGYNYWYQYDL